MTVSSIHIYPIKSLRGISVISTTVEKRGLEMDRRRMLVDEEGMFLTQRKIPRMALVDVALRDGLMKISAEGWGGVDVPLQPSDEWLTVQVWQSVVQAKAVSEEADRWFSDFLGMRCRLVEMPEETKREVHEAYSAPGDIVSFADGFPLLAISQASLDDLNSKLDHSLPMNRFRPNVVIADATPFAEDGWKRVRVGEVEFKAPKLCGRCAVTTTNQLTAEVGQEPLRTLATYRKDGSAVMFGVNWTPVYLGEIKVGDEVVPLA